MLPRRFACQEHQISGGGGEPCYLLTNNRMHVLEAESSQECRWYHLGEGSVCTLITSNAVICQYAHFTLISENLYVVLPSRAGRYLPTGRTHDALIIDIEWVF